LDKPKRRRAQQLSYYFNIHSDWELCYRPFDIVAGPCFVLNGYREMMIKL